MNASSLVFGALLGAATACAGTQLPLQQISSPGGALFNGRVRPEIDCYSCHKGDATGTWRGPNLTKGVPNLSDREIADAIASGPGLMPSFRGKLNDDEVKQLIGWLRERARAASTGRP